MAWLGTDELGMGGDEGQGWVPWLQQPTGAPPAGCMQTPSVRHLRMQPEPPPRPAPPAALLPPQAPFYVNDPADVLATLNKLAELQGAPAPPAASPSVSFA